MKPGEFWFLPWALLYGLITAPALAQDSSVVVKQFWLDYNYSYSLGPHWDLYGDTGFRWLTPIESYRLFARPSIRHVSKDELYEFHGGVGFFYTQTRNLFNISEVRPFQGFRLNWPHIRRQVFHNFWRLEERWFFARSGTQKFDLRLRWRLSTVVNFKEDASIDYFFSPLAVEIFGNATTESRKFHNRLRLIAGLGYVIGRQWTGQFEFFYQGSRDSADNIFDNDDIVFRFRVIQTISGEKGSQPLLQGTQE